MRKAAAKQRVRQHRANSEPEAARPEAKRGERPKIAKNQSVIKSVHRLGTAEAHIKFEINV